MRGYQLTATKLVDKCLKRGDRARFRGDHRSLRKDYLLKPETGCGNYKRVDIYLEVTFADHNKWPLTETYFIECKSSLADLHSGYGVNFKGDRNFLLIPSHEVQEQFVSSGGYLKISDAVQKLDDLHRPDVGILQIDPKGRIRCVRQSWLASDKQFGHLFQVAFGDYYEGEEQWE